LFRRAAPLERRRHVRSLARVLLRNPAERLERGALDLHRRQCESHGDSFFVELARAARARPREQQLALALVARELRRALELSLGFGEPAELAQQLAAHAR